MKVQLLINYMSRYYLLIAELKDIIVFSSFIGTPKTIKAADKLNLEVNNTETFRLVFDLNHYFISSIKTLSKAILSTTEHSTGLRTRYKDGFMYIHYSISTLIEANMTVEDIREEFLRQFNQEIQLIYIHKYPTNLPAPSLDCFSIYVKVKLHNLVRLCFYEQQLLSETELNANTQLNIKHHIKNTRYVRPLEFYSSMAPEEKIQFNEKLKELVQKEIDYFNQTNKTQIKTINEHNTILTNQRR